MKFTKVISKYVRVSVAIAVSAPIINLFEIKPVRNFPFRVSTRVDDFKLVIL